MTAQTLKKPKKAGVLLAILLILAAGIIWYLTRPVSTPLTLHGNVDVRQV